MANRKHISWKTKCASALLMLGRVPYSDAKEMTEDQFLSLFQWDHNILHETGFPDVDKFWNLEPKFIREHREKTKHDAKIIAKGRRIRNREEDRLLIQIASWDPPKWDHEVAQRYFGLVEKRVARQKRKIQSRGFDKRYKRKMDGTVARRDD